MIKALLHGHLALLQMSFLRLLATVVCEVEDLLSKFVLLELVAEG
jgi:hypothetical protein